MKFILSDINEHKIFLPLSFTRSVADFRVGITTIKEKWEYFLNSKIYIETVDYLQNKYENFSNEVDKCIKINATVIPNKTLVSAILNLQNETLKDGDFIIASSIDSNTNVSKSIQYENDFLRLKNITDIFSLNGKYIENDFYLLTSGRKSEKISKTNVILGTQPVFVEEGCFIECCTINTMEGPVYIGRNAVVSEGSHIRGSFALCNNSEIKMGAKIFSNTTIGPYCKVGGEINNTVFFGYSNKAHDGFLGNSIIGEWCNLGAGTNSSNLKNNYDFVKLWNFETKLFEKTELMFCGLIMGDYSKCGINTMFNTGTIVGVAANIFGAGFPNKYIPAFSWGGHDGFTEYKIEAALETIKKQMERRNKQMSNIEKEILIKIFKNKF